MDSLSIKKNNGKALIYFDTDYGKKLDTYTRGGFLHFNFKKRTDGIGTEEFLDFLIQILNNIKITNSLIKNEFYDFSNELKSFIYKFNSIGFDINSVLKDHGYEDEYYINKRKVIEDYYNSCINNLDGNSLTGFIELVNKLYYFQVKVFKAKDLFYLKDDLMDNLKDACSLDVYNHYNNIYNSYLKEEILDLKKLEGLFLEIQSIIIDDWKNNLSSVDDYKLGSPFKFICHSTDSNGWNGDYINRFVSASLLTENHTYTYNQPYGFIMDPKNIVMAYSEDLFIKNDSSDLENLYNSGALPIVHSFKNVNENTLYYNEVVLDGFNPIGIFCITDGSKELNPYYLKALKLKENFPDLPILDFDISFFESDIDSILSRNDLIDAIEEELGTYNNGGPNYYDYFSYFWDDFMALKSSDYSSSDIINLFMKYYNLLNIDLDELLNGNFDDDFVLKLIGANSRYSSINHIFSGYYNGDDIRTFYEIYSDLSSSSYNRLDKLFPGFNNFINLLDNYLISNEYNVDSLDILGKIKNFDELISYLNDFYSNDTLELDEKKYLH